MSNRSVPSVHEDYEDDDNTEIIVVQASLKVVSLELVSGLSHSKIFQKSIQM
jgi:hypothetical protein